MRSQNKTSRPASASRAAAARPPAQDPPAGRVEPISPEEAFAFIQPSTNQQPEFVRARYRIRYDDASEPEREGVLSEFKAQYPTLAVKTFWYREAVEQRYREQYEAARDPAERAKVLDTFGKNDPEVAIESAWYLGCRRRCEKDLASLEPLQPTTEEARIVSASGEVTPPPPTTGQEPSAFRAQIVADFIEELNTLKPLICVQRDIEKCRQKFPTFRVFGLVEKHPDLMEKLANIREHRRHYRFAQELAAALYGKELSTIQTDWKKHKPPKFRQPKTAPKPRE